MRKLKWLMFAGLLAGCVYGGMNLRFAQATPPKGFAATSIIGPAVLEEFSTTAETEDWEAKIKIRGRSEVYITNIKIAPGGHGGWHSHPGPSIISVKSGTATLYDDCIDPTFPYVYAAGSAFVEDADCVHLLANEGTVDLEVIVIQIVPFEAPRRIDQPAP